MEDGPNWPTTVDRTILHDLHEEGPDYLPLVASRRGLHVETARRRCEQLVERGYVEKISEEVVYRITERGVAELEAMRAADDAGSSRIVGRGADE